MTITDEMLDAATLALVEDYEPGWRNVLSSRAKDVLLSQYRTSARAALEATLPVILAAERERIGKLLTTIDGAVNDAMAGRPLDDVIGEIGRAVDLLRSGWDQQ